ncbi:hypothetical protein GF385_01925 [Candidatus Dependentiae bacterium]|nr:hypothetical protein [Candidatus Dependentiae bacterium]
MIKLKKTLIFILLAYVFILVSRFHSILVGNIFIKQLDKAMVMKDIPKQKDILKSVGDSYQVKKGLNQVFKGNRDELLNYLALIGDTKVLKKYFNVLDISQINEKTKLLLLEKSLASGSLKLATKIMKSGIKPTSEMILRNLDSISRENDLKTIRNFVSEIKKMDLMDTLLEYRDIYGQDPNLKALIHYVAMRGNLNWLKVLIENDVTVKLEDIWKNTAFHLIVTTLLPDTLDKKVDFINYMINKKNIDILYKNRDDKTAHDLAVDYLNKYKKLLEENKNSDSLIFKEMIKNKIKVYKKLDIILGKLQRD